MCSACQDSGWVKSSRWYEDEMGKHEDVEGVRACRHCDAGGNLALACAERGFEAVIYA